MSVRAREIPQAGRAFKDKTQPSICWRKRVERFRFFYCENQFRNVLQWTLKVNTYNIYK
jgi:hypothetical protein